MKFPILFLFTFFFFDSFAQIQLKWADEVVVNEDATKGYSRPKLALSNGNPVLIWGKRSNKEVYSSYYDNGYFTAAKKLTPEGMTAFAQDWIGPEIASQENLVAMVFEAQPEGTGYPYMVLSQDGGITFSDTILVVADARTRFPTVAIGPNKEIYVAYMQFEKDYKDPHYAVVKYNSSTKTFNTPVSGSGIAPGEVCDCCPANLVIDQDQVTLFFRNNDDDIRDIWAATSTDEGKTFNIREEIDSSNWHIGACPSSGPSGVSVQSKLVYTWMSGASGKTRVMIGQADKSSLTIDKNDFIYSKTASTASQNYPFIAGQFDVLGVVWQEVFQGKTSIMFSASITGYSGLRGFTPIQINQSTDGIPQNPVIKYSNGRFHIAWQDLRNKKVLYRTVSVENITNSIVEENVETIKQFPNPSDGVIHFKSQTPISMVTVSNAKGQVLLKQVYEENSFGETIGIENLSGGVYFMNYLHSTGAIESRRLILIK
jgi:hypothetical protein